MYTYKKKFREPGMVAHSCILRIWKVKAGELLQVEIQPGLQRATLSPQNHKQTNIWRAWAYILKMWCIRALGLPLCFLLTVALEMYTPFVFHAKEL